MSSNYVMKSRSSMAQPLETGKSSLVTTTGSVSNNTYLIDVRNSETVMTRDHDLWMTYQRQKRRAARKGKPIAPHVGFIMGRTDMGGAFESTKRRTWSTPDGVRAKGSVNVFGNIYSVDCPVLARSSQVPLGSRLFPPGPANLESEMIRRGTTAIARTIPTNPYASASQFIGELRDRLPAVPGQNLIGKKGTPSGYADEYLNLEFGLKPIISDLRKFRTAAQQSNKIIAQLKRDSGRIVRRRYSFPEETTTEHTVESASWYGSPTFNSWLYGSSGKLTRTRVITSRYWFSGAYTYAYPSGDRAVDRLARVEQEANRLFGTRITPSTLWELTPWSWAADWVSNAGDVMTNLSAFSRDGLVMVYGYVMCEYTATDTYRLEGLSFPGHSGPLTQVFETKVKKRIRATPYGFGLDPAAFTTRQWAILGALGVSRSSRTP